MKVATPTPKKTKLEKPTLKSNTIKPHRPKKGDYTWVG